ncbi:unnamed protein product [Caenorhabditis sp. 36 PRJEB53466]|nr:unnamed protein product [Caenorhabditis sp. 36 PRJEB53466]
MVPNTAQPCPQRRRLEESVEKIRLKSKVEKLKKELQDVIVDRDEKIKKRGTMIQMYDKSNVQLRHALAKIERQNKRLELSVKVKEMEEKEQKSREIIEILEEKAKCLDGSLAEMREDDNNKQKTIDDLNKKCDDLERCLESKEERIQDKEKQIERKDNIIQIIDGQMKKEMRKRDELILDTGILFAMAVDTTNQQSPNVLNWIEVWATRRPLQILDSFRSQPVLCRNAFMCDGFCDRKKMPLQFITTKENSISYQNMLQNAIVPFFRHRRRSHTFQQDNASIHKRFSTQNWLAAKGIKDLQWPACSPDLNPVENVQDLKDALLIEWNLVTAAELKNLVSSMPNRLFEVIQKNGGETKTDSTRRQEQKDLISLGTTGPTVLTDEEMENEWERARDHVLNEPIYNEEMAGERRSLFNPDVPSHKLPQKVVRPPNIYPLFHAWAIKYKCFNQANQLLHEENSALRRHVLMSERYGIQAEQEREKRLIAERKRQRETEMMRKSYQAELRIVKTEKWRQMGTSKADCIELGDEEEPEQSAEAQYFMRSLWTDFDAPNAQGPSRQGQPCSCGGRKSRSDHHPHIVLPVPPLFSETDWAEAVAYTRTCPVYLDSRLANIKCLFNPEPNKFGKRKMPQIVKRVANHCFLFVSYHAHENPKESAFAAWEHEKRDENKVLEWRKWREQLVKVQEFQLSKKWIYFDKKTPIR